jgi:hypothetical protein
MLSVLQLMVLVTIPTLPKQKPGLRLARPGLRSARPCRE